MSKTVPLKSSSPEAKSAPPTPSTATPEASPSLPRSGRLERKATPHKKLVGMSDIRRFFFRNDVPVYFISATNFNLLSMDEWVRRFRFINYLDCFDGRHPNVFVPSDQPHETFESLEQIVNYLLRHPETQEFIRSRGEGAKAAFLFFDEETEKICADLGLEVCFPPAALRTEVDNKMATTRIGNRAKVRSVPNVLTDKVRSYADLKKAAASKKLGKDLVVQTAFGDSGHTTFFIADEADWQEHADEITGEGEIKIMKRIRPRGAALEACVTRAGTIVGPLMTELVGFSELTPYRGGWCGNEVYAGAFSAKVREQARKKTVALGAELEKLGYRGYFEVDYLIDEDRGTLYLGEINPRITGASSMTNLAAFAHADAPLFLFHLLEFFDVEFELDVEALNERWAAAENIDSWSQLVIKHTADTVEQVTTAPASGVWQLDEADASVHFLRPQTHRRTVERDNEGFFLRITKVGDYRYEGADLGILITPGRLMDDNFQLTDRAKAWIRGIRDQFAATPIDPVDKLREAVDMPEVGKFKML